MKKYILISLVLFTSSLFSQRNTAHIDLPTESKLLFIENNSSIMIKLRNLINKIKKSNSSIRETNFLLSSNANARHLKKSIKQLNEGKAIKINLKDLWK